MSKNYKIALGFVVALGMFVASSTFAASAPMTFSRNLSKGATGADVKQLQQFLNSCADTQLASVAGTAGSPGYETMYFGPATTNAVKAYQAKNMVSPVLGNFFALTRAKAAAVGNVCGTNPTNPNQPQTGPISAMLSTTNPASGVIVAGQATADLAHITFSGNGVVNSVMLKRSGISDQNTLTNVYLYDGVTRLTDGYSFNSNGEITINNLNLAVGGSRTVSVKADVYASAPSGQTIAVSLVTFTAGTSVNTVSIMGNTMSIASGSTLATVALSGSNTVSAASVNAGTSSYAVWRQAFQVNTRTLWLKSANFRLTGSAPADALQNVGLYVDGVKIGGNAAMTMTNGSNYLSFDMSSVPMQLTTGSHTFEVRADIVKGSSYNVTVSLQQASDIMVYDPQVGVNVAVSSFTASTAGTITIGTGSATVVIDPTFNTMTNVTGGASNIAIAKFKVRGYGEDIKVTSITATPVLSGSTPAAAGLQNVTLFFNGAQVGSQQSWTSGALTFNLGSQMIIPAGIDSVLEVRADLRTSGGTNYTAGTVSANIGTGTAEGWNSKASITTPAQTGNSLTIQTGLLAVAKNTGYANQVQNPNTAGVKIGSYVLQNQSSSESVRVTSLTVAIGGSVTLTNLSGLKTSETSGSGSTPVQPQASNVFSVDFTLAPGATKTVDVFADTSSETGTNVITTLAATGLGSSSNTSISVSAVTGQTVSFSAGTLATPTILTASSTSAQYVAAGDPMNTGTGATDATKASYTFVSTGGAATISELKFTISGSATNPVMSVKIGGVTAPVFSGVAWLQGLNLAVPNGGSGLSVDAFITYAPVGTSGVTPNTTAITTLTYVKYSSGGTTTELTPSVAAPTITVVGSKPTVSISATQNTGLNISGVGKIGEVTIAADAKGNVKLNTLVFTVSSSGFSTAPTAVAGTVISDSNSSSTPISGAVCTPASLVVTCTLDTNANPATGFDGYTVTAGTSKTFSLFGSLTGAAATGSGTPTITSALAASTFNWDDTSTNGASGVNLSGSLIYGFPNSSFSIKQ
jgi:hypothetical protein